MKNVTVRLPDEYVETLDDEADAFDLSRAEYLRDLIERGRESGETQDELEATQAIVDDLRQQLQAVNARDRDVDQLVGYVEEERAIHQRERERRDAAVWTRMKWWVLGRGDGPATA
jgi:Arc/MetJ-type ribon-helix-helix transcriptional regulator